MNTMLTAFSTVAMMLLCALPGFIAIKTRILREESIPVLARVLLYICQPALIFYSLSGIPYSTGLLLDMLLVFLLSLVLIGGTIGLVFFLLRRRVAEARFRIYTIATALGNFGFMGVPMLKALLPGYPEALAFSTVFSVSLNLLAWTVACSVISLDTRYISLKKIFLNPPVLALPFALILFIMGITLPAPITGTINYLAEMSTPLCMLIMGARLALSDFRRIFLTPVHYLVVGVKQILLPAATLGILLLLSVTADLRAAVYILMCCPVASVILNFSEMLGEGQESAAGLVLLGTILSALTLPLMTLLL